MPLARQVLQMIEAFCGEEAFVTLRNSGTLLVGSACGYQQEALGLQGGGVYSCWGLKRAADDVKLIARVCPVAW